MPITIKLRIINDTEDDIRVLDKHGGSADAKWTYMKHGYALTMSHSGTSGSILFESTWAERFVLVTGVHNHKRWCDVNVDVSEDASLESVHKKYYGGHGLEDKVKWKQLGHAKNATKKGKKVAITFYEDEGSDLAAVLVYY